MAYTLRHGLKKPATWAGSRILFQADYLILRVYSVSDFPLALTLTKTVVVEPEAKVTSKLLPGAEL